MARPKEMIFTFTVKINPKIKKGEARDLVKRTKTKLEGLDLGDDYLVHDQSVKLQKHVEGDPKGLDKVF